VKVFAHGLSLSRWQSTKVIVNDRGSLFDGRIQLHLLDPHCHYRMTASHGACNVVARICFGNGTRHRAGVGSADLDSHRMREFNRVAAGRFTVSKSPPARAPIRLPAISSAPSELYPFVFFLLRAHSN